MAGKWLKERFPEATISILAQSEVKDELLKNSFINEVLVYDQGRFSLFQMERRLLYKLKAHEFDLVTILYNNVSGRGYLNVDLLAFLIRSRYKLVFDSEGEGYLLTPVSWIYRRFIKKGVCFLLHQLEIILIMISVLIKMGRRHIAMDMSSKRR